MATLFMCVCPLSRINFDFQVYSYSQLGHLLRLSWLLCHSSTLSVSLSLFAPFHSPLSSFLFLPLFLSLFVSSLYFALSSPWRSFLFLCISNSHAPGQHPHQISWLVKVRWASACSQSACFSLLSCTLSLAAFSRMSRWIDTSEEKENQIEQKCRWVHFCPFLSLSLSLFLNTHCKDYLNGQCNKGHTFSLALFTYAPLFLLSSPFLCLCLCQLYSVYTDDSKWWEAEGG